MIGATRIVQSVVYKITDESEPAWMLGAQGNLLGIAWFVVVLRHEPGLNPADATHKNEVRAEAGPVTAEAEL